MLAQKLLKKLERVEDKRQSLLEELKSLDPQTLNKRPTPTSWSILEIVEHLVLAEYHVFRGLPEYKSLKHKKRGLISWPFYWMVIGILHFNIPVQVPARNMNPQGDQSLDELISRWDQSQNWLKQFLSQLDDHKINDAVFTHPAPGPMTPGQTIRIRSSEAIRRNPLHHFAVRHTNLGPCKLVPLFLRQRPASATRPKARILLRRISD